MNFLKKLIPNKDDSTTTRNFKILTYLFLSVILFMIVVTFITFFLSLRSAEPTMVPDLDGLRVEKALVELQQKGLYSKVQLLYSNDFKDKGLVIGQDPSPSTIVKAGSVVTLKVSNGSSKDRVENFINWTVDDLENHLVSLSTVYSGLYNLVKPYVRVFSDLPAGTIIDQEPSPGTELTGLTDLVLVVSKGQEDSLVELQDFLGKSYELAINNLINKGLNFLIRSREASGNEREGIIVRQIPEGDSEISITSLIQLEMTEPNVPTGYIFGVLERSLPEQPVPVVVRMDIIDPDGQSSTAFSLMHEGGVITLPYLVKEGSILVITQAGNEIIRYTVRNNL